MKNSQKMQKAILSTVAVLALALSLQAQTAFPPPEALPFRAEEMAVNQGIIQSVEFDGHKANVTLKNRTGKKQNVDVSIYVLSKDGITVWEVRDQGDELREPLEPSAKSSQTFDFKPGLPHSLAFYPGHLDLTPKWVVFVDNSTPSELD